MENQSIGQEYKLARNVKLQKGDRWQSVDLKKNPTLRGMVTEHRYGFTPDECDRDKRFDFFRPGKEQAQ